MKRLFLSIITVASVLAVQAQRLLIVNDTLAIDVKDIDYISFTKDPQSPYRLLPEELAIDPNTTIFYQALQQTGLVDSLLVFEDSNYPNDLQGKSLYIRAKVEGSVLTYFLTSRPRRFTAFVEPDDVFHSAGINNIDDLKAWAKKVYDEVYPNDASINDLTNRRNSLNRFVSYHFLRFANGYNKLTAVNDLNKNLANHMTGEVRDVTAFYETMMPYSSLKCSYPRNVLPEGIYLNRRGLQDSCTIRGIHVLLDGDKYDHWTDNGTYFYIDNLLAYDKMTQKEVLNDMWRVDFKTLSPDLLNINCRYAEDVMWALPNGFVDNFKTDAELVARHPESPWWSTYEGDAIFCPGMRYVTIKLPPLPQGCWQVRLGYIVSAERPIINTYIDNVPQFSYIDLRKYWPFEERAEDDNVFNGPDDYFQGGARENCLSYKIGCVCHVIGTINSDGAQDHYLQIEYPKTNPDIYLPLDYLEFVPIK